MLPLPKARTFQHELNEQLLLSAIYVHNYYILQIDKAHETFTGFEELRAGYQGLRDGLSKIEQAQAEYQAQLTVSALHTRFDGVQYAAWTSACHGIQRS